MKYVLGLGRTGVSLSKYLLQHQLPFIAWDDSDINREKAILMGVDVVDPNRAPWHSISEIISSPGIPLTHPKPHQAIELARQYRVPIRGDIDYWAQTQQGLGCQFIGITGTNGKSTTHAMIQHVLTTLNRKHFSGGNNGVPVFESGRLEHDTLVNLELSSYQLDLIHNIEFHAAVLLNITPDHLDRHGSMAAYVQAKASLLEAVIPSGIKVVGIDTQPSLEVYQRLKSQKVDNLIPISTGPLAEGVYMEKSCIYRAKEGGRELLGTIPSEIYGEHQAQNVMAAMLMCEYVGISIAQFFDAMKTYLGLEHRQEIVLETDKGLFINDSKATNADAVLPALKTFKNIYWIAGGLSKDEGVAPLLNNLHNVKRVYLIGSSAEAFLTQLKDSGLDIKMMETLENALQEVQLDLEKSAEKVTVLLSPAAASFDQFTSFEFRGKKFKELVAQNFSCA